jgi:hypothetical protein
MRKLMSLMLGLSLMTTTVAVGFAQPDTAKKKQAKKGHKGGKKSKKGSSTTTQPPK